MNIRLFKKMLRYFFPDVTIPGGTLTALTIGSATITSLATMPVIPAAVVAALGSSGDDAAPLATGFSHVTGADATKGVILPAAAAGKVCIIKNSDAANNTLKVYPATGDGINAITVGTEIAMGAKTSAMFVAIDATTWYTIPLLPS